ncbi:hypothetical protein [Mesorhizobium sp.]|uniref:hypothetical protein n=1 Tax=Mesorhizobium sp. TaxID=1871066 RepID=UPI000FE89D28|nr:hypothetical protein [Mesorhizobium sp.]RWQ57837.1 MAG: hypothetical protein EOS84_04690 [Mesorhizobium sp.]
MTKSTKPPRRINEAWLPIWSALSLIAAFSFASFVGGYIAGYRIGNDRTAFSNGDRSPGRPANEGTENSAGAKAEAISVETALENINLIEYQWSERIRYISASNFDSAFVKDIFYAIWLSGYECEYISDIKSSAAEILRTSVSRQIDDPESVQRTGIPGVQLEAWDLEKLRHLIQQGKIAAARRLIVDHLTPFMQTSGFDVVKLDKSGAIVTCGSFRYRVASTLGSGGILVAAPL